MDDLILPLPFPRGVMDPRGAAAYIADAGGGISAIDLNTGIISWSTKEAERSLICLNDRLVALRRQDAQALLVIMPDIAHTGAVLLRSDPIVFPEWVSVDPQSTEQFTCNVWVREQLLLLSWEAHSFYKGGAAPSQRVLQQESYTALCAMELESGRMIWELPLEERRSTRPPPLRQ